jgi:hypothetical protein
MRRLSPRNIRHYRNAWSVVHTPKTRKVLQPQHVIIRRFHYAVALTTGCFQPLSISESDFTAPILEQACFFQFLYSARNTDPIRAEHLRERLLRNRYGVTVQPVVHKQQPARQALLGQMETITDGSLDNLPEHVEEEIEDRPA